MYLPYTGWLSSCRLPGFSVQSIIPGSENQTCRGSLMPDDTAMTIKDMLESRARLYADHVALLAPNRPPLTYRALLDHTHRIAAQLKQARLCHKDRIAVVLP